MAWESQGRDADWFRDDDALLFKSEKRDDGTTSLKKFELIGGEEPYAVCHGFESGPAFGAGCDLAFYDEDGVWLATEFSSSFTTEQGELFGAGIADSKVVDDLEVYAM